MGQGPGVAAAADRRGNRCRGAGAIVQSRAGSRPELRYRRRTLPHRLARGDAGARRSGDAVGNDKRSISMPRSPGNASSTNMSSSKPRTSGNAFAACRRRSATRSENVDRQAPQLVEPLPRYSSSRSRPTGRCTRLTAQRRCASRSWPRVGRGRCCGNRSQDPLQEIALRGKLPALTPIEDQNRRSRAAGPVPALGQGHLDLAAANGRGCRASVTCQYGGTLSLDVAENPDVLIAGCGSGESAIEAAARLSRCARARRRRECRGSGLRSAPGAVAGTCSNIEFACADILKLAAARPQLRRDRSDGVLHHLGRSIGGLERTAIAAAPRRRDEDRSAQRDRACMSLAGAREFAAQGNYQPDSGRRPALPPESAPAAGRQSGHDRNAEPPNSIATGTCRDLFFGAARPPDDAAGHSGLPRTPTGSNSSGLETSARVRSSFRGHASRIRPRAPTFRPGMPSRASIRTCSRPCTSSGCASRGGPSEQVPAS